MKIIITGSLGNIGKPLATELLTKGHEVIVISSNPNKQQAIEKLGAKAAIGKLEDASFLVSTFMGADAVYCMIPFDFNQTDQKAYFQKIGDNYVQAINQAGIRQAVFLSGWAADITTSFNIRTLLEKLSDTAVTELRPGSFYSNFYSYIGMIKQYGAIMANYGGEDKIAFVAPEDIASAAAEELTIPFKGKKIRYVASEELTCNQAAHSLGEAIGKPDLQWITISDEQFRNSLLQTGMPAQLVDDLVRMQAATHSGVVYENYLQHRPVLGKIKLNEFAKEFANAYNQ